MNVGACRRGHGRLKLHPKYGRPYCPTCSAEVKERIRNMRKRVQKSTKALKKATRLISSLRPLKKMITHDEARKILDDFHKTFPGLKEMTKAMLPATGVTEVEMDANDSVLLEAHKMVYGERQQDYGHPIDDFQLTIDLINRYFQHKIRIPFTAQDWGKFMIFAKLSRDHNRPKRDNLADGSGYFETIHRIRKELAKRQAKWADSEVAHKMFEKPSDVPTHLKELSKIHGKKVRRSKER